MPADIVHEAVYPHPPERVWQALTTRDALRAWLMENTFEGPTVGHRFRFTAKPVPGWNGVTDCEVLEAVPGRRLVLSWHGGGNNPSTKVTWTLDAVAGGTRLRLVHSGLTGFKGWMMRMAMKNGWGRMVHRHIPVVLPYLAKGEPVTPEIVAAECGHR